MQRAELLIELLTEELPARGLSELARSFADLVVEALKKRGLAADYRDAEALWTPRRLTVLVPGLETAQAEQVNERRGPALAAGMDAEGKPAKALLGFAASCGVAVEALERLETDKGSWFVFRTRTPGRSTVELLPEVIKEALKALPIAKPMRWGDGEHSFLRPVHGLLVLLGREVVDMELFGVRSGDTTVGHRFHAPEPLHIEHADTYVESLRKAKVMVDPVERAREIRDNSRAKAMRARGTPQMREDLVDEVSNLNEWPVPLLCEIPKEFMRLPDEVIISTIESHQKFFPVLDANGKLLPSFIGVANLDSRDPQQVRKGYERVTRPRLADAAFFFDRDLATPLAQHQEGLRKVTFQGKLGSLWEKTQRVARLAETLAPAFVINPSQARAAAELSRCDLLSQMVGEFPELQGKMGRTYLERQGGDPEVALALDEFYSPRGAGQPIAASPLGQLLAVAERLDTLAGIFALGQKPSGNKDPFSLRRAGLGLARTLIEGGRRINLHVALSDAVAAVREVLEAQRGPKDAPMPASSALVEELYGFVLDRLRAYYADNGVDGRVLDAVAALRLDDLSDFDRRAKACVAFMKLPAWESLAAANKRIRNILRKAESEIGDSVVPALLTEAAEIELFEATHAAASATAPLKAAEAHVELLTRLAELQAPVNRFFDTVMVMAENAGVRRNRLGLLKTLQDQFLQVADVSLLASG